MAESKKPRPQMKKSQQKTRKKPPLVSQNPSPSPKITFRNFFSCKHHHQSNPNNNTNNKNNNKKRCRRMKCSGSLCSFKENSMGTQRIARAQVDAASAAKKRVAMKAAPLTEINGAVVAPSFNSCSSIGGSFKGMHLGRFSGCYECHMVVDPLNGMSKVPSLRSVVCPFPDCGEIFMKSESLELHQAVRHAVSELGPEDTSRNIVEIIFQSSWLKKETPVCKIERILKVQNTPKTISKFEDYRDSIKSKANKLAKKHPRCIADGNELLRFHCTTMKCSLGFNGSTNLCDSIPHCSVCGIIRDGFKTDELGMITTMATSGRAHDIARISSVDDKRVMLVCRVIAGRVTKNQDNSEECDSVANVTGVYSNLDELSVFNPKAILPCFVLIYSGF
ncbi:putative transcription factor C2H2 family [Dioscorea sansibarensis]